MLRPTCAFLSLSTPGLVIDSKIGSNMNTRGPHCIVNYSFLASYELLIFMI